MIAFDGCHNLKEVTFDEKFALETIGQTAFFVTLIETVFIHKIHKEIGEFAFDDLKNVEFERNSKLGIVGDNAFCRTVIERSQAGKKLPSYAKKIGL